MSRIRPTVVTAVVTLPALPYLLRVYRADGTLLFQQGLSAASRGGAWGLCYGWVAGLVTALVHRPTGVRRAATSFPGS